MARSFYAARGASRKCAARPPISRECSLTLRRRCGWLHPRLRSNGLHRRVHRSMRPRPRVSPLQRSAYSVSSSCTLGEGIVNHRRCSSRYEMIVEDLAELPFGKIRGEVERCVPVPQTGGEQRYIKDRGLCKSYVQAQVGYRKAVIGPDQLRPAGGRPSRSANSTLSRAMGSRRTVLSPAAAPLQGWLPRSVSRTLPVPNESRGCERFFVVAVEAYPHPGIDHSSVDFVVGQLQQPAQAYRA